jgi:uncharacterized protein involved in exopolysaccharide biosynthesis
VLGNGAMQQLMAERAQARAALVEERQFRKDAHPEMREARARLAALDDQAESMANTIRASLRQEYEVAAHGEKQIASEIAALEGDARVERGRDMQMSMMSRSVETYRLLHDSLLQRYRDMASQAGFQAGRIQPLDRAAVAAIGGSPAARRAALREHIADLLPGWIASGDGYARHLHAQVAAEAVIDALADTR